MHTLLLIFTEDNFVQDLFYGMFYQKKISFGMAISLLKQ